MEFQIPKEKVKTKTLKKLYSNQIRFKSQREKSKPGSEAIKGTGEYRFKSQREKSKHKTNANVSTNSIVLNPKGKSQNVDFELDPKKCYSSFKSQREKSKLHEKAHFPDFP